MITVDAGRNAAELLALLECFGSVTRSDLVRLSGLPRTTVTGTISDLIGRELVMERAIAEGTRDAHAPHKPRTAHSAQTTNAPPGAHAVPEAHAPQVGRPPRFLSLAAPPTLTAVLCGGQSGVEAALVTYPGEIVARGSTQEIVGTQTGEVGAITVAGGDLVEAMLAGANCRRGQLGSVVIGLPRPVGPAEAAVALAERLGVPVRVENDANLGALGEASYGAGAGHDSLVYLKLGYNVGAGVVIGGRLHRGASGFAGELAHVQVRADGEVCRRCGGRGCLAAIVGSSLLDYARRSYEERLALPQLLALVAEREPGVRRVFADLGRLVGEPLAGLCTMLDPAAVIIDGALGAAGQYVLAGIRESLDRRTAPVVADSISVIPGELGDRAELLGGAALARQLRLDAVRGTRGDRAASGQTSRPWGTPGGTAWRP